MAILARYVPTGIIVQVVDVLTAGNRKRVLIRAIEGEPFHVQTHGGPMDTSRAVVNPDQLEDVHQEPAPEPEPQPVAGRRSRLNGTALPVIRYTQEEQERFATFCPSRARALNRQVSAARGGLNND